MQSFPRRSKLSLEKKITVMETDYKQFLYKPNGFWYACGKSWYRFLKQEHMYEEQYLHSVLLHRNSKTDIHNPDPNKLLVISNKEDLKTFEKSI